MKRIDVLASSHSRWCCAAAAVAVALMLTARPLHAAVADPYDDVTAWWHFDYASSGTIGSTSEIRDQRHWGTASTPGGGYNATSIAGTPSWTTTSFTNGVGPAGGQPYGGAALHLAPVDNAGTVNADGFAVSNLAVTGSATFVTRFMWDGYATASTTNVQNAWIYYNDFQYGDPTTTAGGGFLFGLSGSGGSPDLLYGNQHTSVGAWTTTPGVWYDMAVVLDKASDSITLYRWEDGGALQTYTNTNATYINNNTYNHGTHVGYESPSGTDTSNAAKSFAGTIDDIAVWNRALSVEEINHAFGDPSPVFKLGLNNGSTDDLRIEFEANNSTYTIGQPWHDAARALSTGVTSTNFNFNLTADQAGLSQIFHLDALSPQGGHPFEINLTVNGHSLGNFTVTSARDLKWDVPASVLQSGNNTVTLNRVAGGTTASYMAWDWMELGGSWQIGQDDNSQSEFILENAAFDNFYVTDPNLKQLSRAITNANQEINLHFELSDLLATQKYLYTTKVISQDGGGQHALNVLVNGMLAEAFPGMADGTLLNVFIDPSLLHAGDNTITLQWNSGTTGYTQFDFHRLTVLVPEPGMAMLLAMGLPLALRRRRRIM